MQAPERNESQRTLLGTMKERILEECSRRGTCPLDRKAFEEAFAGWDLTIQVRSAIDFAQQNGLAFGRSAGDQRFVFSRLPKLSKTDDYQRRRPRTEAMHRANRGSQSKAKFRSPSNRPFGRSF